MYDGCEIEVLVDIRDVEEGLYSFEIVDGTNKAIITVPVLPATFRKDKAAHESRISEDYVKKAHDALRSTYSKLPKQDQVRKHSVVFPPGYKLTQKPFVSAASVDGEAGVSEKVKPMLVVYKSDTNKKDKQGATVYQLFGRLCWKVCDAASATALTEQAGDAGVDTVSQGFAGL